MEIIDEVLDLDKIYTPSQEDIEVRNIIVEKYFTLILGIIKSSINTSESLTISERYFPDKEIFGGVMIKIGEYFGSNEDIEVNYQKPEDKNPSSPTFGNILCKFVVNNLALIRANKIIKDECKMALNAVSKENKEKIIETVEKKYEKKEE